MVRTLKLPLLIVPVPQFATYWSRPRGGRLAAVRRSGRGTLRWPSTSTVAFCGSVPWSKRPSERPKAKLMLLYMFAGLDVASSDASDDQYSEFVVLLPVWPIPCRRAHAVRPLIIVNGDADLFEIVVALSPPRGFASRLNSGEQQRNQHRDDRDDDQQFDQSKRAAIHESRTFLKI